MTAVQWTAYLLAFLAMNWRVISMSIDSKVRPTGSHTYIILLSVKNHIVAIYVSSREVAATDNSCSEPWTMKPNRIWIAHRTPLVIRGCSILRPFGQQLSHFIFSKLRLSNPNLKNIIKFSSAAKKFEENLRNKGFFNTKNKNAKRNDEEKTAKIPFFSCSK